MMAGSCVRGLRNPAAPPPVLESVERSLYQCAVGSGNARHHRRTADLLEGSRTSPVDPPICLTAS